MSAIDRAQGMLIEALGRQSLFWGLGKITGELYAVLYISEHPLSLAELAATLAVTKGNVSIAVRRLEDLAMVRRQFVAGDRRVYFVAETDFWLIARRFLERRHRPEFDKSFRLVRESFAEAETPDSESNRAILSERIRDLVNFYEDLDTVTNMLLELEPTQIHAMVKTLTSLSASAPEQS